MRIPLFRPMHTTTSVNSGVISQSTALRPRPPTSAKQQHTPHAFVGMWSWEITSGRCAISGEHKRCGKSSDFPHRQVIGQNGGVMSTSGADIVVSSGGKRPKRSQ